MPENERRKDAEPKNAEPGTMLSQRDEHWDERLRFVGNANFVHVEWSGKDNPSWPLPKK